MEKQIAYITSLIGDSVRTNILWSLLDGRAYTATELAIRADTTLPNISSHLSKLVKAELLVVESQGRHKYYRFARHEVAYAIEAIGSLIPDKQHKPSTSNLKNGDIKYCRTCYDHLAGRVGVLVTESLIRKNLIGMAQSEYEVTAAGNLFFNDFGIDIKELSKHRRSFAKPCLDWSERKHHLAGSLGAAMLKTMLEQDWIRRTGNSRVVIVTSKGRRELYDRLRVEV